MKQITFIIILAAIVISCTSKRQPPSEPVNLTQLLTDSLTAELDSMQKAGGIVGFAVSIVNQNGTLYEKGFGYSNIETKEKYTQHTIQHIASISKTLIGIALMKAQEMGKLKLDDPIQHYLSFKVFNPYHPDAQITIRQLATHTSGINDTDEYYMAKSWVLTKNQDLENVSTEYPAQTLNPSDSIMSIEKYLKEYLNVTGAYYQKNNYIDFKAGERHNYSNVGSTLAALVLEKATGQAFDEFTQQYILKPLNMNASGWALTDVDIDKHSRLYRADHTLLPFYTAITYPDGMLITSSSDIAKYTTELIKGFRGEGTLLSNESYKEFYKKQLTDSNFEEGSRNASHPYNGDYDPAIFIGHSALGFAGHSGGDAGVSTWLYFNKEKSTGMYMAINTDIGDRKRELEYYAIWEKMEEYVDRLNQ
ncbi:CubicO group peptidase, beta-lactamase class C family [Marivirga sericea]|uniref:CubicO group peptidase, beta-lactamase class C family n=1 Tax=Marivirga sericea TaxID=1028 RepID=A0A1X7JLY9_9BACT|nr:serine hydrolase domain-containing protein [Marivirga sericea]SMG28853.1 CubicO group peptidase, beta-lactamase class C family [Marivirga sericea]